MSDTFQPSPSVYEDMYNYEDTHWWYRGLRDIILYWVNIINPQSILDVGSGTGANLSMLQSQGYKDLYGIDISDSAITFCKKRNLNNVSKAGVLKLPFEDNKFDLIICMDVLGVLAEEDYEKAFIVMKRCLKSGGILLLNVAALPILFSSHDKAWDIKKRFVKSEIMSLANKSGYTIIRCFYRVSLLFPLVASYKFFSKYLSKSKRGDTNKTNETINNLLYLVMRIEFQLLKSWDMPIGSSLFLIAKKN